ncbi:MAG: phosphoribosylaminoimidazolesuccinocarboxamide synthase [Elusimicrobia bacterium]|nr:phosphoribosylaminoimidazolesuccinocarboxamide synthase [Elusimicrobiota bacterium]
MGGKMEKKQGKVRDIFELGDKLILVSTDRVSCFDVILKSKIPDKGKFLNKISSFWFRNLNGIETHFISDRFEDFPAEFRGNRYADRSVLVRKAEPIRIECVVRRFVKDTSGGWRKLSEAIFTPAIKNDSGHDENIDFGRLCEITGGELAEELREKSFAVFEQGYSLLEKRGLTLLDSKFEFGKIDESLILIDEVLTPDSSRFLDEDGEHLDKEFLREFLKRENWNLKEPLPEKIIEEVRRRYEKAEKRILH